MQLSTTPTPLSEGKERSAIEDQEVAAYNEHQMPEGKIAESERCDTDNIYIHRAPDADDDR